MAAGTKCRLRSWGPTTDRVKYSQYKKELEKIGNGLNRTLRIFELTYTDGNFQIFETYLGGAMSGYCRLQFMIWNPNDAQYIPP